MSFASFSKTNNSSKDASSFAPSFCSANMCAVSAGADNTTKFYIAVITDIVFTMSVLLCLFVINALFALGIITLALAFIIKLNKLPKKRSTAECV